MKPASIFIATALAAWLSINSTNTVSDIATDVPATGRSTERKAILDVLRQEIKQLHGLEVVFVVKQLKIRNNWAWLHALPQSRDGKNRYEDVIALLHKRDSRWEIMAMPCTEEDNPECLGDPEFFNRLQHRFKEIPPEILSP